MPRLAIGPDLPGALGALAPSARREVLAALRRFLHNAPGSPHAERVRGGHDPRVATLRLAEGVRGVVVRQRDVYWLLTVLPDAAAWETAVRRRYGINPVIGVVEEWDAEALERVEPALRRSAGASRLFDPICDGDLLALGLDVRILPLVRHITTEADVEAVEPYLPPTQHRPLAVLAVGGSMSEAWRELDECRAVEEEPGEVDPEDFYAALRRSPDRAVFVDSLAALERLLDAPDWGVFLHPPQHRLARTTGWRHPVLVTGAAGTGKTLIALHRAAHLAQHGEGRVLLVTFSQGLREELSRRLDLLIEDAIVRKRIDVENPDHLALRIVADAEGRQPVLAGPGARSLTALAEEAAGLLDMPVGDLLDADVSSGRGEVRKPYRHVVVDEGQDVSPAQWRLLRAAAPRGADDLFVVGDPHQRVTENRVSLESLGIHAVQHSLRISYRLPQELLSFGVRLRGGGPANGLVKGVAGLGGYRAARHGERPMIRRYESAEAELAGLATTVRGWLAEGVRPGQIAAAARTTALVRAGRRALDGLGVLVTSFHGLKGLEFDRVALYGVAEGVVPDPPPVEPGARARALLRERSVLFVACTRARSLLYISHYGRGSPFLSL
ncbi:UvrD-helicase domain-containing protein [Nonomuraea sp. NPDC050328]|uniref:UvrD-helicase domain-containing protein n=1 Tax=Nonomuraea sp. NPDC050328 TaxID=3364361 RepID=UPI0037A102D9